VKRSPRYSEIISLAAPGQETGGGAAATILRASGSERKKLLETFIQETAARVLGISPSKLDPARPLNELGLDSLMGIELVNRLEDGLGLPFPTEKLLGAPSIATLARILNETMPGSTAEEEPTAAAPAENGESSDAEPVKKGILNRIINVLSGPK
jgi:acyl carrier protein